MRATSASNGRQDKTKTKKHDDTIKNTDNTQNQEQLDPEMKAKVQTLMDMTNCTQDNAIFALHDSDNDVNSAVNLLLESNNDVQGGWQEQKTKSKKKQAQAVSEPADTDTQNQSDSWNDDWKENSRSTERPSYPRNAPPRLQRGGRRGGRDGDNFSSDRQRGGYSGGDRGRGRGRGGRGRGGARDGGFGGRSEGGYNRGGGFRDRDQSNNPPADTSAPQIGTWTSEADANPKTDSWGEMWTGEDDNQWQGDLKGTHVFEATSKPSDTFPTADTFDPTAAAALATPPQTQTPPAQQNTASMNGNATQQTQPSLNIDTLFPKQQVETLNPPSVSSAHYDNQLASDSIKSAIGMSTQSASQQIDDKKSSPPSGTQSAIGGGLPQRQAQRQQRSKLPPPSTKIPTAPVEMPHTASSSVMDRLGVQFGAMDFGADSGGLSFDAGGSMNSGYSTGTSGAVSGNLQMNTPSQQTSMYSSDMKSVSSVSGPEPIPFPPNTSSQQSGSNVTSQQPQSQSSQSNNSSSSLYGAQQPSSGSGKPPSSSAHVSSNHSGYPSTQGNTPSASQYKQQSSSLSSSQQGAQLSQQQGTHQTSSSSTTDHSQSAFHNTTSSRQPSQANSGGFYQNLQSDSRSGGYQATSQPSNHYTSSLYSSNDPQANYYNAGAAVSSATSLSAGSTVPISTHIGGVGAQSSTQQQSRSSAPLPTTSKAPPNLPPPAAQPVMQMPGGSYMIPGLQYYTNQPFYPATNLEDMQKYQQMAGGAAGYYDMSQYSMPNSSISAFPGTGSGDGKMARLDAQSPTVQGGQANPASQSQQVQGQSSQSNTQNQQYMSLPPGYHPTAGYYYPGVMSPYGIFQQMPTVTQNMSMPGTNTAGVYSSQKSGSTNSGAGGGSSYYGGNNSAAGGYDDGMSHSASDFNKYNSANKQNSNLSAGSGTANSGDLSSMYKSGTNSQANAAMYGASPAGAYMTTHAAAAHMMPNQQHLMQSQIGQAQDNNVGGRGSQSGMGKSHSKQSYYNNAGWGN